MLCAVNGRPAQMLSTASAVITLPGLRLARHRSVPNRLAVSQHRLLKTADCCHRSAPQQHRSLWTPGSGYRPRRDDPHKRPVLALRDEASIASARIRRGHPWIFPRDVRDAAQLSQLPPCVVNVQAPDGDILGVALYNPRSNSIAARMLSPQAFVQIDVAFFAERLRRCLAYREQLFMEPFYRLVHGEADGLPGLVIDRYGDHVVVQATAAGLDALLWPLIDALEETVAPKVIILRQDAVGRKRERAPMRAEVLKGQYVGPTEVRENGVTFVADLLGGQKTGWYYDHRDHRALLAGLAGNVTSVLDAYCYTGGFGITMAQYGVERVVCVDSSEPALELCRRSAAANAVGARVEAVRADSIEFMEQYSQDADASHGDGPGLASATEKFDLVIVDPPNLGMERSNTPRALRYYERLVCAAAGVCASPGFLFVASCTYHISGPELLEAINRAIGWAGRGPAQGAARVVASGGQAADHPGHPALPESRYLRSFLLHLE